MSQNSVPTSTSEMEKTEGCGCMQRRTVLKGVAAIGMMGLGGGGAALAQGTSPAAMPPQPGDFLVLTTGNTPLTPADIRSTTQLAEAFAMAPDGTVRNEFMNTVLLMKYDEGALAPEVAEKSGEGVLGYSTICTHSGCPVNTRLDGTLIACDCHGSRFDPTMNGDVANGPAARKLPQLTIGVQDGKLVVLEGFDGKIGGDSFGDEDR